MRFLILPLVAALSLPAWASDADIVAARDAVRRNDVPALMTAMAGSQNDLLAPYPAYWQLTRDLDNASDADVRAFMTRWPNSVLAERVRADWLRRVARRGDWSTFAAEIPALPDVALDDELRCQKLTLRVFQSDAAAIAEAKGGRWMIGKLQSPGCETLLGTLVSGGHASEADIWRRARVLMTADRLSAARDLTAGLATPLTQEQQKAAASANPSTPAGAALRLYAVTRLVNSNLAAAEAAMNQIDGRVPAAEASEVWSMIGLRAARRQDVQLAMRAFARTNRSSLDDNQWQWWARSALRAGDWQTLEKVIDAMPDKLAQKGDWRYWKGRALMAQGKPGANGEFVKASNDGNGFYALLAREELGNSMSSPPEKWQPGRKDLARVDASPSVQRALALFQISQVYSRPEFRSDAQREWRFVMRDQDDAFLLASAERASKAGFYEMAIYSADRTDDRHDWEMRYMSPYRDSTRRYARMLDLDEAWIYGLIRQESRFVHMARSGVGAQGLMQVMPATARWIAGKMGVKDYSIMDVDTNIQFGTWYLNYVNQSLGHPVLATAGYNAGPGRARAWRAAVPLEGAIYTETIPFDETRDYVKKVMANAVHYASVFKHTPLTLKARLGIIPASVAPIDGPASAAPDGR